MVDVICPECGKKYSTRQYRPAKFCPNCTDKHNNRKYYEVYRQNPLWRKSRSKKECQRSKTPRAKIVEWRKQIEKHLDKINALRERIRKMEEQNGK